MERKFTPFLQPPQRALSKPATERLPSVDEITAFENELKALQTRTTERVTLVDANIAALERLAKKMKEKDKLKVKVLPKVRRGSTGAFKSANKTSCTHVCLCLELDLLDKCGHALTTPCFIH